MYDNSKRLFQRTVLNNFVKEQDHEKIQIAYAKCKAYFGDSAIYLKIERNFDEKTLDLFDELDNHITTLKNYFDSTIYSESNPALLEDLVVIKKVLIG